MRITNSMISNRMLLNINKNMRNVDKLYNQLSTGKQIMFPSDNPILASRALKFRTSVAETEQYQRNVAQGLSWMEVTEGGFNNVTNILSRLRELAEQGTSDENRFDDRQKIATDMQELIKQLGTEMNISYAGRYVFSGYRTNEPPTFEKDYAGKYNITQQFKATDIEIASTYQRAQDSISVPGVTFSNIVSHTDVNIVKLAYKDVNITNTAPLGPAVTVGGVNTAVTYVSLATSPDAYKVGSNDIHYIEETGELVLGATVAQDLKNGDVLEVKYDKTGFNKGELNPKVYFDCNDQNGSYTMDDQTLEYEFGVNTRIGINSLAKNVYTDKMYADLVSFCETINSMQANTVSSLMAAGMSEDDAKQQVTNEENRLKDIMQNRFNNLLGMIDKYEGNTTKEHTDMGSRMSRLELIQNRLVDDKLSYQTLLSENEDVDYMEAAMNLNAAESVYQASLQVGAKIIQMSLANFIG